MCEIEVRGRMGQDGERGFAGRYEEKRTSGSINNQ